MFHVKNIAKAPKSKKKEHSDEEDDDDAGGKISQRVSYFLNFRISEFLNFKQLSHSPSALVAL